jgi:hypothetical protein
MDIVIMLIVFLAIGFVCGAVGTREVAMEWARRQEPEKPICACGHHQCFHDEKGVCHNLVDPIGCGCQQYMGPQFLNEMYLPPHE